MASYHRHHKRLLGLVSLMGLFVLSESRSIAQTTLTYKYSGGIVSGSVTFVNLPLNYTGFVGPTFSYASSIASFSVTAGAAGTISYPATGQCHFEYGSYWAFELSQGAIVAWRLAPSMMCVEQATYSGYTIYAQVDIDTEKNASVLCSGCGSGESAEYYQYWVDIGGIRDIIGPEIIISASTPGTWTLTSVQTGTTPLEISPITLPDARNGQTYSPVTLTATGGSGKDYAWCVQSGSTCVQSGSPLPAGFTLSTSGVLSWIGNPPVPADSYAFPVQVTDSSGNLATQIFTIGIQCPGGPVIVTPDASGEYMFATFTPPPTVGNANPTLAQYAAACGFSSFDWQQMITAFPTSYGTFQPNNPAPLIASGNVVYLDTVVSPNDGRCTASWTNCSLIAPPAFNDPPKGGYVYLGASDPYPYYYPVGNFFSAPGTRCTLKNQCPPFQYQVSSDGTMFSFLDDPADASLAGDSPSRNPTPGHFMGFQTSLVGLDSQGGAHTLYSWKWNSTFNGTAGGTYQTASLYAIDAGSGRGGVTVTSIDGIPIAACDVGTMGATGIQLIVNEALGAGPAANDLNGDGVVDVADVQLAIDAVLLSICVAQ